MMLKISRKTYDVTVTKSGKWYNWNAKIEGIPGTTSWSRRTSGEPYCRQAIEIAATEQTPRARIVRFSLRTVHPIRMMVKARLASWGRIQRKQYPILTLSKTDTVTDAGFTALANQLLREAAGVGVRSHLDFINRKDLTIMGNNTIITKMREIRRKAVLVQHEKLALRSGLVSERKIWKVPRSERYPDGFKYRMVLTDPIAHSTVLLYDNHWPKGPHIHWLGAERPYEFVSLEQLMVDFLRKSAVEEARFYESKKNRD